MKKKTDLERIREEQFKIAEEFHTKLAQDFDKKIIEFYNNRKRYFKYVPIKLYLKFFVIEFHRPMLPEITRTESGIQMRATQEIRIRKKKLKDIINQIYLFFYKECYLGEYQPLRTLQKN